MIEYLNILGKLSAAGYSTYRLRKENLIPGSTLDRLHRGDPVTTATIDTICRLCECQPSDLLAYRPDDPPDSPS